MSLCKIKSQNQPKKLCKEKIPQYEMGIPIYPSEGLSDLNFSFGHSYFGPSNLFRISEFVFRILRELALHIYRIGGSLIFPGYLKTVSP
jgi:hypothetical protein